MIGNKLLNCAFLALALSVSSGCARWEDEAWLGPLTRGGPPPKDAPNVLIVSLDTLRGDRVPWVGYERNTAPALDALRQEGAWFSQSWSQAPQTDGSHAAMFTGRLSSTHGKYNYNHKLPDSETTLAEYFREHGYRTWGIASSDKFLVESGFAQGFEDWELFAEGPVNQRGDDAMVAALDQLDDDSDTPWLGFLHLFDVHAPYTAPEPHRSAFHSGDFAIPPRDSVRYIRDHRRDGDHDPAVVESLSDLYDAGIRYVDSRIAQLDGAIRSQPRDIVVVFISDHGEAFNEHGYLGHSRVMWEEVMRVPWVVWAPGRVSPGTRIDAPSQSADLFPTLTDMAGLPPAPELDGESFATALEGGPVDVDATRPIVLQGSRRWGVLQPTEDALYKLIITVNKKQRRRLGLGKSIDPAKHLLFDLSEDPGERKNLAQSNPQMRDRLGAFLLGLGAGDPFSKTVERTDIDAEDREALRALGYVDE